MKLSLIIPVYNVEKYIEKCLLSCIHQDMSFDDYEIIILNDGSKDNSYELAKRIVQNIPNARVLSHDNGGLSYTRNRGIEEASGDYVWFIDSDDWIVENCLKNVYQKVAGKDVLSLSFIVFDELNGKQRSHVSIIDGVVSGKDYLAERRKIVHMAQMYVFKREFLNANHLRFYEGIYHEDIEFTSRALYKAGKMSALEEPVYYLLRRDNSITTTVNPKRSFDLLKVALSLDDYSKSVDSKAIESFHYTISVSLNTALFLSEGFAKEDKEKLKKELYDNRHLFCHLRQAYLRKFRLEGFLFSCFPRNTIAVYNFLKVFSLQ